MQKSLVLASKAGSWQVTDTPIVTPGKGEVLVKILSTALNPVDWKVQKYGAFVEKYPAVLGSDAAGEVDSVGEGVGEFKKGDRVVFQGWFIDEGPKATFQQYGLVPAEILAKIPSNMSFHQAATLPLGLATAVTGLYNQPDKGGLGLAPFFAPDGKGKYADQSIVILGGSSSVGQYAIQAARESGFSPIIATSSLKHTDYLLSLGATRVVNRQGDPSAGIKEALGGKLTDVVFDAISSKDTQQLALDVLTPDGSLILTLLPAEGLDVGKRTVTRMFGNVHAQREIGVQLYKALPDLLVSGTIKPNKFEVLPGGLQAIVDGLKRMENDQVSGIKLVAHPWD